MTAADQVTADTQSLYGLDVLLACDMGGDQIKWASGPVEAMVEGKWLSAVKVFDSLEHHGYIQTDRRSKTLKVTAKGQDALRVWNSAGAGL